MQLNLPIKFLSIYLCDFNYSDIKFNLKDIFHHCEKQKDEQMKTFQIKEICTLQS